MAAMYFIYAVVLLVCHLLIIDGVDNMKRGLSSELIQHSNNSSFKTVCYYPMSSNLNASGPDPLPLGMNPSLCTHIIFIPTSIDNDSAICPTTPGHAQVFLKAIPALRKINPRLTIMVSNGGNFDLVLKSMANTKRFVASAVIFLRKYDFDGLDLDWEFPGWPLAEKPLRQIHSFSIVLTELRIAFEKESRQTNKTRLLLSAAVAATKEMAEKIYEKEYLIKALDFVNMMGYDYNGFLELFAFTAYNSPLFPETYDKYFFRTNNLAWSATHWGQWVGKDKVMVGIPFYCHAFKLLTPSIHGYHAPAIGKGECDQAEYKCACNALKTKNATRVFDDGAKVPYLYYGDQWVTYDDTVSITLKTKWIIDNGFAGLMVWNMIADDYEGVCDGKTTYPLMKAVLKVLEDHR